MNTLNTKSFYTSLIIVSGLTTFAMYAYVFSIDRCNPYYNALHDMICFDNQHNFNAAVNMTTPFIMVAVVVLFVGLIGSIRLERKARKARLAELLND